MRFDLQKICRPAVWASLAAFIISCLAMTPLMAAPQLESNEKFSAFHLRFFEKRVLPILQTRCFRCHGNYPGELGGGLALISRASILKGGESGPAVDLKNPLNSRLLDAIYYGAYQMPPDGRLPSDELAILTQWVELKMPWPAETANRLIEAPKKETTAANSPAARSFWSFQPVSKPQAPDVENSNWVENQIDRFVLANLESRQLQPASPASKQALIRRAYYDLTGLPPTPQQVANFVNDSDDDAYSRLIDRLLASPRYGEKWGRHWLDVVRYAESNSFERDAKKPFVWRYRDYVISAFNNDKPYNQFLLEQLAGDEVDEPTTESIIATGYYRLGQWDDEPADPQQAMFDELDDILATTSQSMLGLTVNCARCHDHKIDPIPTKDYYRMLAFFRGIRRYGINDIRSVRKASTRLLKKLQIPSEQVIANYYAKLDRHRATMDEVVEIVKTDLNQVELQEFVHVENHERIIKKRLETKLITQDQFDRYIRARDAMGVLLKDPPDFIRVLCVKESGPTAPKTRVLIRGNPKITGEEVEPGFLSVLPQSEPNVVPRENSTGRRLAFAKWVANDENPLTARVMVNRIWQHHFGRGIVRTSNDFGFQGTRPTHPRLLDYLAATFVENGWSVKSMHRMIMLSNTYRMSNEFNSRADAVDPLNDLLWRFDMRRLTAEELRDSILAVSGQLNRDQMFGPPVFPKLSSEVLAGQSVPGNGWGKSSADQANRRSVYIHLKRSLRVPLLEAFDIADTDATCPVRFNTVQPTQALASINGEFVHQQAHAFANDVKSKVQRRRQQVDEILSRVLQRPPKETEITAGLDLIHNWIEQDNVAEDQALAYYCLAAFNLNEFIFVE